MSKLIVIITSDYFLPGYKAGGPIRTLANLVDHLGDQFHFRVVTRDRDLGDDISYPGISTDSWQKVDETDVFYLTPQNFSIRVLYNLLRTTKHDLIYLNSLFSTFTINVLLLRWLRIIPNVPIILAPRGELSPGAMVLKAFKKRVYLALAKLFRLYCGVIWQASSGYEELDIFRWFGIKVPVMVAPDLPPKINRARVVSPIRKEKPVGFLKIVFLSRISRMKNLDGAINLLSELKGEVLFDIYGPLEDQSYWQECKILLNHLPVNIKVGYHGGVQPKHVLDVLGEYHLFFLPSFGENFGHVILEALKAGCPVLLSDQTPWRDLEMKGVGWDIPLDQPEHFQNVLQQCVEMDAQTHEKWSQRACVYGLQYSDDKAILKKNKLLFIQALTRKVAYL